MCGIVGFIGDVPAAPVVLRAISKLEYRGYDSAGMVSISGGMIHFQKDVGSIADVQSEHRLDQLAGEVALAHVRWATHGRVTQANAHPHFDCRKQVALVHNGVIENYQELRAGLGARHTLVSEGDTEVICHMMEDYIEEGYPLEVALIRTMDRVKGSYAIAAVSPRDPDKIVATAKDSPLIVGLAGNNYFVASDALSFLDKTSEVVFLEEGEIACLTRNGASFFDRQGSEIAKESQVVSWQWDEATKEGYESFMLKEIVEEPQAIRRALGQDGGSIRELAREVSRASQVVMLACGSSRHAALVRKYLLSRVGGKLCHVITASEFQYFADSIAEGALVIAVSQSGETADVIDGVRRAKERGAMVFSIVNVVGSLLTRISDRVIYIDCGPEIGVAATKSFVGQVVTFYLLAFTLIGELEAGIQTLEQISRQIQDNFEQSDIKARELAQITRGEGNFFYLGRGLNLAIAAEGALKLKEVSYVQAECMPAGEMKHGTLALIEEATPVIAVCPKDDAYYETVSNIMEIKARGGFVVGVSDEHNESYDQWIEVPKVNEVCYPFVAIMPLHLLAYHVAVARGKDPDRPRHLAKSVTVK